MNNKIDYDKTTSFSVLSANVGNLSLGCKKVLNKLCYKDVEKRIAENIQTLSPDIVALQEVLAPWQCVHTEKDKRKVCSDKQLVPQVRRLVGNDYTISCNSRNQFECIAVKKSFGEIIGCQNGDMCHNARTVPEIAGCDNGFTISAVTVKPSKFSFSFDVINFHPQSTNAKCRAKMISAALYGDTNTNSIIKEKNILLLGDFNLDPWRDNDESVFLWKNFVNENYSEMEIKYHSGIAENNPPLFTSFLLYRPRTFDFILSNFTEGVCLTLGESPNTVRIDGGKGMDHRALYGVLSLRR